MMSTKIARRLATLMIASLVAILAMPAFAAAQTPTSAQYDPADEQLETLTAQGGGGGGGGDDPSGGLDRNVGPLPFTGFDVIAMAAVALAVTGLGLALQRAVSRGPAGL